MLDYKNRFFKIIILFFIFFGILGFCQRPWVLAEESSKEQESLFVAKKAFEDGFYEVSQELLERFLKAYPNSKHTPEVHLLIGQCYFNQNRYLDALAKFQETLNNPLAKDMKDAIFYWLAEVHFSGDNFDKASSYYKKIIEEFPASDYVPAAYYSLGWCYFQEGKIKDALGYFRIVEDKYSKESQSKDVPLKIMECLYILKDYTSLKEKVKSYLNLYSNDSTRLPYLYFYMAEAEYYLNSFTEAINSYSKVLSNSQDEKIISLSSLGTAWSYLKLKKYKDAEDNLNNIRLENLNKESQYILLLGKAILFMETNRADEARRQYEELLTLADDELVLIQAYLGKAEALYNLAEYREAIKAYEEALSRNWPNSVPGELIDKLHYGLSWSFLKEGEFKKAINEFQKIVKTSDDKILKVSALCQIGDTYQDSGDYVKAQETYDTILKNYPDNFYTDYVQYQLGITLLKASNYDGAIMSFLALKRNFQHSKLLDDATYALGLTYFQKQDYNSSKEVFGNFHEEFKDSNLRPQALYLLGTSLYNLGQFEGAIEIFKDIIRIYNHDTELVQKAEYEIADCFYQMGNEKEAMKRFKVLRSKYPASRLTAEIMWWLGGYYYRHNDFVLSRRYFLSLIQDFPKSNLVADAYYALGSSYEEEANHEEAIENFRKVIDLGNMDLSGQAAIAIADIYLKKDKPDLALEEYRNISINYPNLDSVIYPKMADLLYKIGEYGRAIDLYRKSLDLAPLREMAQIQFKIAEVLQTQGESEEAIEEYLKVTYLYSQNNKLAIKALLRVAEIYEGRENFRAAVDIYNRIIAMNTEEAKYAKERIDWIKANIR